MTIDISERITFLKSIHLFNGLSDEQLFAIANALKEEFHPTQATVLREGSPAKGFFLIYGGKVRLTARQKKGGTRQLAVLDHGDYFGEEALIASHHRSATVSVEDDALLLSLSQQDLQNFLKQIPKLKPNFDISIASRKLSRRLQFKWLHENEVIYFLARKHPIMLWWGLAGPFFVAIVAIILSVVGWWLYNSALMWGAIIALVPIALWALWNAIDWSNDYYIVTNQRVIWLEKVIGIYDSRQEAPLSTIISVGVETDFLGRLLDYGNVIVRTYVGRILLSRVFHPYQAGALVEEHWSRAKEISRKAEEEAMRQALRNRLVPEQKPAPTPPPPPPPPPKLSLGQRLFGNIFKLRFESVTTITYRKHWFVLFAQTWIPGLLWWVMVVFLIYWLSSVKIPVGSLLTDIEADTLLTVWLVAFIIVSLWWLYQYVDWRNDIFQVTPDQILDIDKKPLGTEERKAAPLDNILSTEYKRVGILGVLFNYGTVYITIGGAQLAFEDVFDPARVQDDIDRRRMARIAKKKEAEVTADRERLADWFAAYHQDAEKMRGQENPTDSGGSGVK